jgi:hypothetical protein
MRFVLCVTLLTGVVATSGFARPVQQAPARPLPAAPAAPAPVPDYVFAGNAGMLFFYVRPDRTADFESVMGQLGVALEASLDPARKQQAAGWRIFRSTEAPRDAVIYIFAFDPAVTGADYDPIKILGNGEISVALKVEADRFSASARAKIEAAGGTVTELDRALSQTLLNSINQVSGASDRLFITLIRESGPALTVLLREVAGLLVAIGPAANVAGKFLEINFIGAAALVLRPHSVCSGEASIETCAAAGRGASAPPAARATAASQRRNFTVCSERR